MASGSSDATIRVYDAVRPMQPSSMGPDMCQMHGDCRLVIPAAREPRSREYVDAHEAPSVLYAIDGGGAVPNVSGHSGAHAERPRARVTQIDQTSSARCSATAKLSSAARTTSA